MRGARRVRNEEIVSGQLSVEGIVAGCELRVAGTEKQLNADFAERRF